MISGQLCLTNIANYSYKRDYIIRKATICHLVYEPCQLMRQCRDYLCFGKCPRDLNHTNDPNPDIAPNSCWKSGKWLENKEIVVTLQKNKRFYGFVLRGEVKLPTAFLYLRRDFCIFVREYSRTIGHSIGPEKPMNEYYRHFRNGKLYRFVTFATIEATGEEAVVPESGKCEWVIGN